MHPPPATNSPRLQLAPHVRACACDDQVILLDLQRNRYLAVAGPQLARLAESVDGWPAAPAAASGASSSDDRNTVTRSLLRQGLLTRELVPSSSPPAMEQAVEALDAEEVADAASLGLPRTLRMLRSAAVAALWLRLLSLQGIADAVAARRDRLQARSLHVPSPETVRDAVAAYLKLRTFVLSAQDRCLHDSVALVGFLAQEGIFPRWVIGVRTRPFAAHAWVQSGRVVLNDLPERVRAYRPILIV